MWWNDPNLAAGAAPELPPLTRDRIEEFLKREEYRYFIDSDGDIGGHWTDFTVYFLLATDDMDVLYLTGRWAERLPLEQRAAALEACNKFQVEHFWPKLNVVDRDNYLDVHAEAVTNLGAGVTDEQLSILLDTGLSAMSQAFEMLADTLLARNPEAPAAN